MPTPISVSIIIPVLNELIGLKQLLPKLLLVENICELVIVDDNSVDGTAKFVSSMAAVHPKLLLLQRTQRGLGSAVRDGAKLCTSSHAIVMDGDGQHGIDDLVSIIDTWKCAQESNGIIVGSRFLDQSSISGFPVYRLWLSRILNAILKLTTRNKTSDPLSGFFLAPITVISSTNTNGFKILYDLLLRSQDNPCMDVPIAFSGRIGGKSKARLFELVELLKILSMSFARQR